MLVTDAGPRRADREDLRAGAARETPELGEAQVVTDERTDLCRADVEHDEVAADGERVAFARKEEVLAVDGADGAARIGDGHAVGDASVGCVLSKSRLQPHLVRSGERRDPFG